MGDPFLPSDDQPDRSAAHKNLVQWLGQIHKETTEGHTHIQLPHCDVYQQHGRATNTHAVDVLLLQARVPRPSSALPPTGREGGRCS